jgi:hypothetical protein
MDNEPLALPKKINSIIFKIIASTLAALFTAMIGFFVYDYFGRENVGIANIEVKQLSFNIQIPKKLGDEMDSLQSERFGGGDSSNNKNKILNQDALVFFLNKQAKRKQRLETSLAKYNSDYLKISNLKNEAAEGNEKSTTPIEKNEIKIIGQRYRVDLVEKEFDTNKFNILSAINDRIEPLNTDLDKIDNVLRKLVKETSEQVKENRSKYQIEVVLFNSGGMQAVVRYKGQLNIEGTVINLMRKKDFSNIPEEIKLYASAVSGKSPQEDFLSNFVIIESKSFNGMTLVVDEYNNRKRDIQFSEREYISGQKKAKLSVYDINDNKYQEKEFSFRNALYEEEKEQIGELLRKEYGEYFKNNLE